MLRTLIAYISDMIYYIIFLLSLSTDISPNCLSKNTYAAQNFVLYSTSVRDTRKLKVAVKRSNETKFLLLRFFALKKEFL